MVHSFEVEDAKKFGSDTAAILYNLRFWLNKNLANARHIHDGRVWTYNSIPAFSELFPYLTEKQIRTRLKKLEDAGVIITGNYNKSPYDKTKWYSVNEEKYSNIPSYYPETPICPNGQIGETQEADQPDQKGAPIPDINTDSKQTYNKTNKKTVFSFEEFWEMYPIKVNKKKAREKYEKISETNRQKIKDTIQDFINHKPFPGYKHPHAATYLNQERWNDEIKTSSLKNNFTEKQLLGRWAAARKHYDNNTAEITILKPEDAEMFERLKETYTEKDFDQAMVGFFSQESKYPQMRIQPSHFLKNFEMYLHLFRSGGKLYGGTKDKTKFGML